VLKGSMTTPSNNSTAMVIQRALALNAMMRA
jgi:hypothetical protein